MKKIFWIFFFIVLLFSIGYADEKVALTTTITGVNVYGDIYLDITSQNFESAGFDPGDLISVEISTKTIEMVVSDLYCLVSAGDFFLDTSGDVVAIEGCMVSFLQKAGIARRFDDVNGQTIWYLNSNEKLDEVTITLIEKHYDPIIANHPALVRTKNRADYDNDSDFANFREVAVGSIAPGTLYRSCSPVDDCLGRSSVADKLSAEAGIRTFLNLCDEEKDLQINPELSLYYHSRRDHVIATHFLEDFTNLYEMEKLGECLTQLVHEETPWLIHCVEGKDRTGFVSILLEDLMGAAREEIEADYVQSFINYFHLEEEKELCREIGYRMVGGMLGQIREYGGAYEYLLQCGMSDENIQLLILKLKGLPTTSGFKDYRLTRVL